MGTCVFCRAGGFFLLRTIHPILTCPMLVYFIDGALTFLGTRKLSPEAHLSDACKKESHSTISNDKPSVSTLTLTHRTYEISQASFCRKFPSLFSAVTWRNVLSLFGFC